MKYKDGDDIELDASLSISLLQPSEHVSSEKQTRAKENWLKLRWRQSSLVQRVNLILRSLGSRWRQSSLGQRHKSIARHTSTWRFIVSSGLVITLIVLAINVSILIWSKARHDGNTLYQGDCTSAKSSLTYSSLAINVLSTLLLGASNAAMQCLCAPTRAEVDKVHATGSWLDIGVSGLRNWNAMERWRKFAWGFILASSLPLHLLYVYVNAGG